jgi:hypothetical protein
MHRNETEYYYYIQFILFIFIIKTVDTNSHFATKTLRVITTNVSTDENFQFRC